MNFDELRALIQSEIKKDNPSFKKLDDNRPAIYKGRVVSKTWLDRNGNLILLISGSAVFLAWYYRQKIIQWIMDYKIKNSIQGSFKFIPESLDLSSEGGLREIMKPSEQKQREELLIKSGGLFAGSSAKVKPSLDIGTGQIKTEVKLTEDQEAQKLEGGEGKRKLKLINTKNILDNNEIMREKYKNHYELKDKIKAVLGYLESDYYITKVWDALQPKNRESILQALKNEIFKLGGDFKSGLAESVESLDVADSLNLRHNLFGFANETKLVYENVEREIIGAVTRDEFKERSMEYIDELLKKFTVSKKSTVNTDRVYLYEFKDQDLRRPNVIVANKNDGLTSFEDIINIKMKVHTREGDKVMTSTEFKQMGPIVKRGQEVEPPQNKEWQIIYSSEQDLLEGRWKAIGSGPEEIFGQIPPTLKPRAQANIIENPKENIPKEIKVGEPPEKKVDIDELMAEAEEASKEGTEEIIKPESTNEPLPSYNPQAINQPSITDVASQKIEPKTIQSSAPSEEAIVNQQMINQIIQNQEEIKKSQQELESLQKEENILKQEEQKTLEPKEITKEQIEQQIPKQQIEQKNIIEVPKEKEKEKEQPLTKEELKPLIEYIEPKKDPLAKQKEMLEKQIQPFKLVDINTTYDINQLAEIKENYNNSVSVFTNTYSSKKTIEYIIDNISSGIIDKNVLKVFAVRVKKILNSININALAALIATFGPTDSLMKQLFFTAQPIDDFTGFDSFKNMVTIKGWKINDIVKLYNVNLTQFMRKFNLV